MDKSKSTLLNAINFRTNKKNLKVEGEISLNGRLVKSISEISSISGYVHQDDLFMGFLKVQEHLMFQVS